MNDSEETSSILKRITKGGGLVLMGTLAKMGLVLVSEVIIIRYLTIKEFGLFSLSFAFANILAVFSTMGMAAGLPAYISHQLEQKNYAKVRSAFSVSLKISISTSIVVALALYASAEFISQQLLHKPLLSEGIKIFAFIVPLIALTNLLTSHLRSIQQVGGKVYFKDIMRPLLAIVFVFFVIVLRLSFRWLLFAYAASFLTTCIVLLIYARGKIQQSIPISQSVNVTKEVVVFAMPLLGVGVIAQLIMWTDTLILGWFHPAEVVGLYNGATRIGQVATLVLTSMAFLYMPIVSRLYSLHDVRNIHVVYATITKWVFILTLPFFLCIFGISESVLGIILGSQYVEASHALQILALGFFAHIILGPNAQTMIAYGKQKINFISLFVGLLLNVVLDILIIPIYGIVGAAVASCVCLILSNSLISYCMYKISGIHPFSRNYLKLIALSITMIIILILMSNAGLFQSHLAIFLLVAVTFPVIIFFTGKISMEERELLAMIEIRLTGRKHWSNKIF